MFLPELGKQIQEERDLSSNNQIIWISAGSNNRESTILAIIVGTKGEFPQNFETTSDLEVLYFKQSL